MGFWGRLLRHRRDFELIFIVAFIAYLGLAGWVDTKIPAWATTSLGLAMLVGFLFFSSRAVIFNAKDVVSRRRRR